MKVKSLLSVKTGSWLLFALFIFAGRHVDAQQEKKKGSLVKEGATPILISDQFSFTEGPSADKKGNVYFTDQPDNKIWKYSTDGVLSVFLDNAGRSNGTFFDRKGNLVTAADETNQMWSISPRKKITVLLKSIDGKLLNGPNDLWIHPGGGIYFTDPYYKRDYWNRQQPPLDGQHVYYLAPGAKSAVRAITTLKKPNGIIGTPDGKYLYVADIGGDKTYKYTIAKNGELINETLFYPKGSDGMTIDKEGNVYLTGKGVTIISKAGDLLENIPIDAGWTANVTFCGKDRRQLFITASKKVFLLDMNVEGVY